MTIRTLALSLLVAAAACGDDGTGGGIDAPPPGTPIRVDGGGVTTPGVNGALNVFVVDADTGAPIAGASVRAGTGDAATWAAGQTSGDGLVTLMDERLAGPQTVHVAVAGRVATTWIGVAGRDVTIPLASVNAAVPTARAAGTIAGWNNLPAPAFGHYTLGVVLTTFTDDVAGPENNLAQPAPGGTPANTCLRSALGNTCAWQLVTRTGPQVHFAVIVDGDPNGTTNDVSDDTYTLVGYAVGDAMDLAANQQVNGENLTILPADQLVDLRLTVPAPPSGLADAVAIPMLDLGADGRIVFPLPTVTPARGSTRVIAPTGRFAGTYDVVALATPPGAAAMPYATTFTRGVATGGATTALTSWPAPVSGVQMSGLTGTFANARGAVRYASIRRGDGAIVWSVSLLDGASAFTLPELDPDPLPVGQLTLEITDADLPAFDAGQFRLDDLAAQLARASGASATFTH